MKNPITLLIVSLLFTLISCEKDPPDHFQDNLAGDMVINNDVRTLNKRIIFQNNSTAYTLYDPVADEKGNPASSINIQVIATLESPGYKEEILQASHIRISDDYAYIGYNTQGPRYLGGIDIVDINPATDPKLISNVVFIDPETNTGKDVSSIDIEPKGTGSSNYIWIAGAEESNELLESPALVERFALNSSNQFET
ncbi:MAG: hypothetical protein JW894_04425, partial [Bacteroidales bacterium]|nr:hypothetical protein [Bacteroidales bacterium]